MCGIAGYIGQSQENRWHETYAMLTALLLTSQRRGRDATGFAALTEPYKNRTKLDILTDKQPLAASRFINQSPKWKSLRHKRSSIVLLHTRWQTHGSSDNTNNLHPFQSHDKSLYMIHNGIIDNHNELIDTHALTTLGECDSESLIRLIEKQCNVPSGIASCLKHTQGSMAIAVMDTISRKIYLARDAGRPLWIMMLDNGQIYFASSNDILLDSYEYVFGRNGYKKLKMLIPLMDNFIYQVYPSGQIITC